MKMNISMVWTKATAGGLPIYFEVHYVMFSLSGLSHSHEWVCTSRTRGRYLATLWCSVAYNFRCGFMSPISEARKATEQGGHSREWHRAILRRLRPHHAGALSGLSDPYGTVALPECFFSFRTPWWRCIPWKQKARKFTINIASKRIG